MSGAMSSGGEQRPAGDGLHAQVAAQLSSRLEPARTEHFLSRAYTVADLAGDAETVEGAAGAAVLDRDTTSEEAEWADTADQVTDKLPTLSTEHGWPHVPPLRHVQGGTDAQFITPEWDAWMRAEGLQRPPLHLRIEDTSPYADKPTLILPAFGAGSSIAHTVQAASDSRQGAVDALARGWSKLIAARREQTAPDATDATPEPAVVEIVEQTAETTAAQPSVDTQPENKSWGADQAWWQEAVVATQGTRARFFLLIQAAQPELSSDQAWRLATQQAYDELKSRCPDGSIVASSHPWDREYMRQVEKVMAARETALSAQRQAHESAVEKHAARLAAVRARRDEYLTWVAERDASVLTVFDRWEQSVLDASAEHEAWYKDRLALNEQEYSGNAVFASAIAATNRRIKPDAEDFDLVLHQWTLDRDEDWESSPYYADFERVKRGLVRVLHAIRGERRANREESPLAEFYWDQVASVSAALIEQGYDDGTAYQAAQNAAAHRALVRYDRAQVASLPSVEEYLR